MNPDKSLPGKTHSNDVASPSAAQLLAAITNSSDDAIISETLDGTITHWNPAAERLFGYSPAEAVGRSMMILIPPDREREEFEQLKRLQHHKKAERFETARVTRDGRFIPVSIVISPILDANSEVIGASTIVRDVSAQRTSADQLRMERDRLRITLASIGDAVIVTDARGFIDFLNPVAEQLTGWTQNEAVSQPLDSVFCIINEGTRLPVENPASIAIREGVIVGLANHTILISKSGSEIAIDDTAAPIRDESGRVLGVVLVFRDVTAIKAVEAFRERLSAIVEGSDDAIIGKDLNGRITSWNQGAERMFGYSQEEALGRQITMLIPQDRLGEETEILRRLRMGERVDHFETVRLTRDRQEVEVSLTISPIRDPEGLVVGASKIARDITEKKESERKLAAAHDELKKHIHHLDKLVAARTAELTETVLDLETFASSLSHDLRAPLRALSGLAAALQQDFGAKIPSEAREMIDRIHDSTGRLTRFVDAVLSYMRIRGQNVSMEDVSLDRLVSEVIEDYPYVRETNAKVQVDAPLLPVLGNDALLLQVLANLVSNAVKFVSPGIRPKLHIWTERIGKRVRLWIEDNGIGVTPADRARIFDLFSRASGSERYEGSGVGLAVVQRAVRRMGGHLGLESEPGSGSRFWVDLQPANGDVVLAS